MGKWVAQSSTHTENILGSTHELHAVIVQGDGLVRESE